MNSLIFGLTFQLISYVTLGLVFYLLAVALKNDRVKMEHPILSKRTTKAALVCLFISQFGYLVLPGENDLWWVLFNASIMTSLATFAYYYKERYERVKIAYVDHTSYLTIPTDRYIEVEPGVWLRVLNKDSQVIAPAEIDLKEIIKDYPPNKWLAIAFKIAANSTFPDHVHPKWEHTYLVEGEAEIFKDYRKLVPGKHIEVPPITKHYFKSLSYCQGISFIET